MPITRLPLQVFRCPTCRADLEVEGQTAGYACPGCGFVPAADGGVIDLVRADDRGAEREYYDSFYSAAAPSRPLTSLAALAPGWVGPDAPLEMRRMWERLGDLRDRVVVVLGNGESRAELYLLTRGPRTLVYSDLSPAGLAARRLAAAADAAQPP